MRGVHFPTEQTSLTRSPKRPRPLEQQRHEIQTHHEGDLLWHAGFPHRHYFEGSVNKVRHP